jgi:hypothetical protein
MQALLRCSFNEVPCVFAAMSDGSYIIGGEFFSHLWHLKPLKMQTLWLHLGM